MIFAVGLSVRIFVMSWLRACSSEPPVPYACQSVMFPVIAPAAGPALALGPPLALGLVVLPLGPPHAAARTKATVRSVIALSFMFSFLPMRAS